MSGLGTIAHGVLVHSKIARGRFSNECGISPAELLSPLYRFASCMSASLENLGHVLKPGKLAMVVMGNNFTRVEGEVRAIPSTEFV